jgi:hypothetical protein
MKTWLRFVVYQGLEGVSLLLIDDAPIPPVGSYIWIYGKFYAVKEHVYEYESLYQFVEIRVQLLPICGVSPSGKYHGSEN